MTESMRNRMFQVMDGVSTTEMTIHLWHLTQFVRAEEILSWLIRNRKTGKDFLVFVQEHHGSILELGRFVLTRIHRDSEPRKIIAGRDYLA